MRKLGIMLLLACAIAWPAMAQTKISGKETCSKPDPNYTIDVGDQAGHTLMLQKLTCTWDTGMVIEGGNTKDSTDVSTSETRGTRTISNGYNMSTLDSGDKFTVRYRGTATAAKDGTVAYDGKWAFISGAGKLKGIKGGGTYKGTGPADGAATVDVEGEYTISPVGAMQGMKSMAPKPQ
jgi:hypothetical protein